MYKISFKFNAPNTLKIFKSWIIQNVAKLHTQTSTDGRGEQNKDFLLYNHRLDTNSYVSSRHRTQTLRVWAMGGSPGELSEELVT